LEGRGGGRKGREGAIWCSLHWIAMLSKSSDLMEVEDYDMAVYESLWSFRKREKRIELLKIERNNNELNSIVLSCVFHQFMKKVNLLSI
jgi:hypothetical protein